MPGFGYGMRLLMDEPNTPQFLDVPNLLDRSLPRGPRMRLWPVLATFGLIVLVSTYFSSQGGQTAAAMEVVSAIIMIGIVIALATTSRLMVRRLRAEQNQLEAVEELIRLRRWPEAGTILEQLLTQPPRTPQTRIQALIFLTTVLGRYNRFEDAIGVQNYLLEHVNLDGGTAHGLRLARAMAMLREDHLFDADRAINEMRQQVTRAGRAMNQAQDAEAGGEHPDQPRGDEKKEEQPQSLSAGLAVVEIYRDVKTGHSAEAIELFDSTLPSLREQLGHRVSDVYMLIARAYDLLDRPAEAQAHFEKATLLSPPAELYRRYPETAVLDGKYQPALSPREAA